MAVGRVATIWRRVYADFFMPSRLGEYRNLLQEALDKGYHICSISSFWEAIKRGTVDPETKYLILRHDIESDLATARAMLEIEQRLGVNSSYYFRLSTIDIPLMKEIHCAGGEAGYHFEEIATIAKQKRLRTHEQVRLEMPSIRDLFKRNLANLREETGLSITIVASHGDFANRKLGLLNLEILKDTQFRKEVNVELEVYDEHLFREVTSRCSDMHGPPFWRPESPLKAVQANERVMLVLVHPGNWHTRRRENLVKDVKRLWEGLRYSMRR